MKKERIEALNVGHTDAGLNPWKYGQGSETVCI